MARLPGELKRNGRSYKVGSPELRSRSNSIPLPRAKPPDDLRHTLVERAVPAEQKHAHVGDGEEGLVARPFRNPPI